jgi:hypothetical protein
MADISARQVNPASSGTDAVNAVPVVRVEHRESTFARMVEQQTAKIPSHIFLISSFVAMSISLSAELTGRRRTSRFVGMWVAPLLIMGVYNKMVKIFGSR